MTAIDITISGDVIHYNVEDDPDIAGLRDHYWKDEVFDITLAGNFFK